MPAKPVPQKITAWSYSRWSLYDKCPFAAKCKHVLRLPEEKNAAMDRGNMIHKGAEDFIKRKEKKLLPELKLFKDELEQLRAGRAMAEEQWTFDNKWGNLGPSGWFAKEAWCRVKIDTGMMDTESNTLLIIDWKSGKPRESYDKLLSLYGLSGFKVFNHVERVIGRLMFTDTGDVVEEVYERKEEKAMQKTWDQRVRPLLSDTTFAPKQGDHCRWCGFSKKKGGPCKY